MLLVKLLATHYLYFYFVLIRIRNIKPIVHFSEWFEIFVDLYYIHYVRAKHKFYPHVDLRAPPNEEISMDWL